MTIGETIRQLRLEQGLSQRQLAGSQITRNMLSQIEHNQAQPSLATVQYLAQTLHTPVSVLLGETPSDPLDQIQHYMASGEYSQALMLLRAAAEPLLAQMEVCCQAIGDFETAYLCLKLNSHKL